MQSFRLQSVIIFLITLKAIFRAAFNAAFEAHSADPRQEEATHRIAWAAVKRSYEKLGNRWVSMDGVDR